MSDLVPLADIIGPHADHLPYSDVHGSVSWFLGATCVCVGAIRQDGRTMVTAETARSLRSHPAVKRLYG